MYKKRTLSCMLCSILLSNYSYAENFDDIITIIGPDGRPMIVPNPKNGSKVADSTKKETIVVKEEKTRFSIWNKFSSKRDAVDSKKSTQEVDVAKQPPQAIELESSKAAAVLPVKINTQPDKALLAPQTPQSLLQQDSEPKKNIQSEPIDKVKNKENTRNGKQEVLPYQVIDGEKYYESEYLESKEFNVDGKKKFYQIPTGIGSIVSGAANWDIVEREQGIDMNWLEKEQKIDTNTQVIALGQHYTVITKEDLINATGIQCVDDKAKRKVKVLSGDNDIVLWPRGSFKDEFVYELVVLQSSISDFKLVSYANKQNNPVFYWPIVIFLDKNGCIFEGASAFHTKSYVATKLQNASLEGFVHVPSGSKYIMFSALEEAMDIPDTKLSNQGQIKLTVIR